MIRARPCSPIATGEGGIVMSRQLRMLPVPVPLGGRTAIGKPRLSAAGGGHPAQKLEAGFFVEP